MPFVVHHFVGCVGNAQVWVTQDSPAASVYLVAELGGEFVVTSCDEWMLKQSELRHYLSQVHTLHTNQQTRDHKAPLGGQANSITL